jgi:nitrite reductase/ring-hydroxylating ferredoxin subunit
VNPTQWHQVVDEVNSLWGPSAKWSKAKDSVWKYAQAISSEEALATVARLFLSDQAHPPTPSEIISKTRAAGGVVALSGPCPHETFAITEWHADGTGKAGICVRCHETFQWPPLKIRTPGDWEDRARIARDIPYGVDA